MGPEELANQDDFASMLDEADQGAHRHVSMGEVVQGPIIMIDREFAFIDFGGKGEAVIALEELKDEEGNITVAIGDEIEASVISLKRGTVLLSKSLRNSQRDLESLENAFKSGLPVEGRVSGSNKGGFDVSIGKFRAFCPISQIDISYVEDPELYVGQSFEFQINEFQDRGKQIVVTRRELLQKDRAVNAEKLRDQLEPGSQLEGVISNIRPFGAFVELGGLEGLIHISELSYARIDNPEEVVKVGDKVTVQLLNIEIDSKGKERISLSLKALEPAPWNSAQDEFEIGQVLNAKIVRIVDFGAFAELIAGVDGLIHISEMSDKHVSHPKEVIEIGQTVEVRILDIDFENHKISLSMRQASVSPEQENSDAPVDQSSERKTKPIEIREPKQGEVVSGAVHKVKPFGVLLKLDHQWGGLVGLLPMEESGTSGINELKRKYSQGKQFTLMVESYDPEKQRIRFGIKSLQELESKKEFQKYQKETSEKSAGGFNTMADALKKLQK